MDAQKIKLLVVKDLKLFFRNRLFAVVTLLSMLAFAAVYFLLPNNVEEGIRLGFYAPQLPLELVQRLEQRSLKVEPSASLDALEESLRQGDLEAGLALTQADLDALTAGQPVNISLLLPPGAPVEYGRSLTLLARMAGNEASYAYSGLTLNLESEGQVLGPDRTGEPVSPRDRLLPMLAVFLLMTETMGLAAIIVEEAEKRTLQALLMTPTRLGEILASKGLMSVGLAFLQVVLLVGVTGGLSLNPLLVITTLFLGALLVTGTGFLIGAAARSQMAVMAWGILAMIVFAIPAVNLMFPGTASRWSHWLPSHYLVDSMHLAMNFGAGWSALWTDLAILLGLGLAALALGVLALQRRFQWA